MTIKKQRIKPNFMKKLHTHFLIAITLFFTVQTPTTTWAFYDISYIYSSPTITELLDETYKYLKIPNKPYRYAQTQTLTYLDQSDLHTNLNIKYNAKIKEIGVNYFSELFKLIIKNELDFNNNYRVFYHAQKREFALFQDLYECLYKTIYKKPLHDFIILRTPNKDYSKFKNINDFLHFYINNGKIKDIHFNYCSSDVQKRLLSVSPSLFGNTNKPNECSFHYFLNSMSWKSINIMNIIQDLFSSFSYDSYFLKYKKEIQELNTLLSETEKDKTGILLQIFIPEKLINSLAYRCEVCGRLYYTDEKPEIHPATIDLDYCKNGPSFYESGLSFDLIQFRLLINQTMLNPNSGIKFFRFYNQTNNMKKYKIKLKQLINKITTDIRIKKEKELS